jgi:cysteine desulfurase / selenocysteine lyase
MNIEQLRQETPACLKQIHFNNAGASLMPTPVYEAVSSHLTLERDIGGYEAENRAQDKLTQMYTALAHLLGAQPHEIAYAENATRAWDMAFYSMPWQAGDRVLTHGSEYASNYLAFLHMAKKRGIAIDVIPSDSSGQLDVSALPKMMTRRTKLIAITHVPTQGGLINPAQQVGEFARQNGILYLLDACQSVGQLEVDVKKIGCHFLSGTGRKFLRGPRGTGFLYVNQDVLPELDPPFIDLHAATWTSADQYTLAADAKRFENWESYVAGRVGLAAATSYANAIGINAIEKRVLHLGKTLRSELNQLKGIRTHDLGESKCAIVTFTHQTEVAQHLAQRLRNQSINVSISVHEYSQLDLGARGLPAVVRASVHYYNTENEIAYFCAAVQK